MASEAVLSKLRRGGQGVLHPEAALSALGSVMASLPSCPSVLTVNPFSWQRYLPSGAPVPPFLEEFGSCDQQFEGNLGAGTFTQGQGGTQRSVNVAAGAGRRQVQQRWSEGEVADMVEAVVEKVVGAQVGRNEPLMAAGVLRA